MPIGQTLDAVRTGWLNPPPDSRPMMRWWWFGPDVERAELDRELTAMAAAGIGGVEVSYVYPLGPDSPELLSDTFCGQLRYAAERARDLGLRFDLTLGSGWSFGGPHIGTELAAKMLHWDRREIPPVSFAIPVAPVAPGAGSWPGERVLAGYLGPGSVGEPADFTMLEVVDGMLRIPAGSGPRQLIIVSARPTGQVVKRAAAGADGPVLDHYSAAAARAHLEHVAEPLLAAVPADLIGSVFCDSLEVYGANWTPAMAEEFERRRGYPLLPRLYQLIIAGEDSDQLRIDYYRTLTELYEENFVTVFRDWAAGHGIPFRIQGYGTPPASVSSYRFADLYEGEGFGWKEITQTRWASSAAHLYGLPVVSSETWTWVHSPSFRATPLDLKGEAHEHLLAGINQFIGHGWPYSPQVDRGLGWYFYAAGALDDRNPWWPVMGELTRYLQRLCWLMRQGVPVADVLIYIPTEDIFPKLGHEVSGSLDLWRETRAHIDPAIPAAIRENGWDFDLVDDHALTVLDPASLPVVILPATSRIPAETQAWLENYRRAGGTVIATRSADGLVDRIADAVGPDLQAFPATGDIGSVHRRLDDADLHLVINTGPFRRTVHTTPRDHRASYEVWSTETGAVIASGSGGPITLDLHPYQSVVVILHDQPIPELGEGNGNGPSTSSGIGGSGIVELKSWSVQFPDEQPVDVTLPHRWENDPARQSFSGTVHYRTTLELDPSFTSGPVVIDFGAGVPTEAGTVDREGVRGNSYRVQLTAPIREVAQVIVNDQPCGMVWAPPYVLDVGGQLRAGTNTIELLVSNTAANALSADTAIHELVEQSRAHFGRRFTMQDLDRALDGVSSGLPGIPVLRAGVS
jgi:hypothetical protein